MFSNRDCTIKFENVKYILKDIIILDNITFTVGRGLHILLGPNGSGKTTILRLASGLAKPTSGEIKICDDSPSPKLVSGTVGDEQIPPWMRVSDYLEAMTRLAGCKSIGDCNSLSRELYHRLNIAGMLEKKGGQLSSGMKRKLQLVAATMRDTRILLLDEPFANLDPESRETIAEVLSKHSEKRTILIATHIIPSKTKPNSIILIENGKIKKLYDTSKLAYLAETNLTPQQLTKNIDIIEKFKPIAIINVENRIWIASTTPHIEKCIKEKICTGKTKIYWHAET